MCEVTTYEEVRAEVDRIYRLPEHQNAPLNQKSWDQLKSVIRAKFTDHPEREWAEAALDSYNCSGA